MNALTSPTWTPERIAELRECAALGLSAAQIAHRMRPLTELAIIGRCAREGIELGVKPPPKPRHGRRAVIDESDPMFGVAPPARADAWRPLNGHEPVLVAQCRADQCPWPISDDGDTGVHRHCCGRPRADGLPYCPEHTALAYAGGRYRRPSALASAFLHSALRYAR